ncbi:MAG: hypothetical protein LC109_03190 [Bacteroidia bacterium]|nr:hypothetical protein [Bacteroidia bacterium]
MLNDTDFVKYVAENYSYLVAEAVRKLEGISVEQYLALVKKHYGDGVMGDLLTALGADLQFTKKFVLNEHHLYGSSRLGVKTHKRVLLRKEFSISGFEEDGTYITDEVTDSLVYVKSEEYFYRVLAQKQYEMSNHLGNVLATVLDRKTGVFDEGADTLMYYVADVVSATLYYPFGSSMMSYSNEEFGYKYSFNGMEKDDEVKGEGNSYTTDYRMLDTRLGRWYSIDPVFYKFPHINPYNNNLNNPIYYLDSRGDCPPCLVAIAVAALLTAPTPLNAPSNDENANDEAMRRASNLHLTWVAAGLLAPATPALGTAGRTAYYWVVTNPIPTYVVGGNVLNALDPNPAADYTPGIPGDEVIGNMIGQAFRSIKNARGFEVAKYYKGKLLQITAGNAKLLGSNNIIIVQGKTTTVLGKNGDLSFVKSAGIHRQGMNIGGLNTLNRNKEWNELVKANTKDGVTNREKVSDVFWNTYKKTWLDEAIKRGDNIRLVSDPFDPKHLYIDGDKAKGLSMFGREIQYLEQNGYRFENGMAIKD